MKTYVKENNEFKFRNIETVLVIRDMGKGITDEEITALKSYFDSEFCPDPNDVYETTIHDYHYNDEYWYEGCIYEFYCEVEVIESNYELHYLFNPHIDVWKKG